jgi:1,2-diacylglycerol 3-alpha-glucosyltransferase
MKILHCCLANFYIDNFGYQENVLPRMHQLQGHDTALLASTETLVGTGLTYVKPSTYKTKDNIPITRIPYVQWLPHFVAKKLRIYNGILNVVEEFNPDIIFIHDCQFISIMKIAGYIRTHPDVKVYVDNHTDFINSGRNWISKNILHKIIYKWCSKKIEPYTRKFYGTFPLRVDFFKDVYGTPPKKTELLLMGVDHTQIDFSQKENIRKRIRKELKLTENDFIIVTGGKLDKLKNIHVLMKAVNDLKIQDVKLMVFGTPTSQMKSEIDSLSKSPNIRLIGWISSERVYDYFFAADLGFFPGTHSVLWEQAVGVGLPCVFKKWDGIQHVDLDGNCLFIGSSDEDEIKKRISGLYKNRNLLNSMKKIAMEKGIPQFSYYEIAKKAIEQ